MASITLYVLFTGEEGFNYQLDEQTINMTGKIKGVLTKGAF